MATQFLQASAIRRVVLSQYSQSTVSAFSTAFNTDWSATLGGTVQLLATTAQPLQAILIVPNGPTLYINGGLARTPTDGVTTNGSPVITSATGLFNQSDIQATVTGTGIPASTTILSVQSATQATLSANATATGSGISLTITRVGGDWVGNDRGTWIVVPAYLVGRTVADGATNTNTTVTSATAAFNSAWDIGAIIAGPGIPSGATITAVGSATSVTISAAATATATSQPLTITRTSSLYTPDIV